jgi:hypothetical protein
VIQLEEEYAHSKKCCRRAALAVLAGHLPIGSVPITKKRDRRRKETNNPTKGEEENCPSSLPSCFISLVAL